MGLFISLYAKLFWICCERKKGYRTPYLKALYPLYFKITQAITLIRYKR